MSETLFPLDLPTLEEHFAEKFVTFKRKSAGMEPKTSLFVIQVLLCLDINRLWHSCTLKS